ncbi:MAG: hypothetical protein PHY47_00940 [Lachnospiraceae bacterium]|nr:hypothetical protein [Lachnospiraceae bacterium]
MWAVLLKIFEVAGPWIGLGVVVIGILACTIYMLWKELSKERADNNANYKAMIESQQKANKDIVHQMFDVVNRNTEAYTRSTEAVKELKESMRDLRITFSK